MRGDNITSSLKGKLLLTALILAISAPATFAQYFSFGKNRVQYQNFNWRYIQSEHFDVYYYTPKNYELAVFTVHSLESAYKQLSEDFRHEISNRIRVIVYDSHNDFSQTNVVPLPIDAEGIGGVTDPWKNRITLPFMGDYADFRHTIHHELVHAVMNDMFYGGSVQSIVQNNIQLDFPLWFSEGISEFESLGWDSNTDMFIRDAVINNYLPPLNRLGGYYAYRGGQSLWNYIAEEYGREKIGEIFQRIKSTRSVEAGFQQSVGLNIEELSNRWQEALKKRYFPEVAERESINDFADLVTERSKSGTYNTSPAISPQGDKIALITNKRGFMDVVVVSAITGKKLKTLIKGEDNVVFEELNLLNPNLTWSPDGSKLALSAKSEGNDDLAIVDYETGKIQQIKFPDIDAIGSVSWSPDGKKIAFDGNIGPYQDIYIYNLETRKFTNLTNDIFTDKEPAWSGDSQSIYFVSDRGDKVALNTFKSDYNMLLNRSLYQKDLYEVKIGAKKATRLTKTPLWDEYQPATTRVGKLIFISDQNGIPNIYEMDLDNRTVAPLTDLASGVMQMSISADGSRLAVNSINKGYLDVFLIKAPFSRMKTSELKPNYWAQRRASESEYERVPATLYAIQMYGDEQGDGRTMASKPAKDMPEELVAKTEPEKKAEAKADTTGAAQQDTTQAEQNGEIDFRNYVFSEFTEEDSTLQKKIEGKFQPEENRTKDGRYQPKKYRLRFSPDLTYASGALNTYYGAFGLMQIVYSDLLGNHQIVFGSNLVFDLRNSDYYLQYGNYKHRINYNATFFHNSSQYQTIYGELLRFRTYGGGLSFQYPLNKFERIDFGGSVIGVSKDYSVLGIGRTDNENSTFFYPEVTYTSDHTLPGFLTPRSGTRYSIGLTSSPPITPNVVQFVSVLGDWRHYFNLGMGYTFAVRASGAASFGRDTQTYFMGGMLGWINQRWARNTIPADRLAQTFLALPALPMRGHPYNTIYGNKFGLLNAEFRFPLFAAILPGPIPVLPLYNLQGVAFVDAGTAWGYDDSNTPNVNEKGFDFKIAKEYNTTITDSQGNTRSVIAVDGDVLIGAGFGLRTILLGLPFRYDVAWPYNRHGFGGKPIHYFTIGIDF